jgi:hypothetical protein
MITLRWRTISRWSLLLLAALLTVPSAAAAQTASEAEAVTVALWPEYDRPEVLVIYRVLLPATVGLPARVRLPIPADAPELAAVAYRDSSGGLLNAVPDRTDGVAADFVEVEALGRELQIEFYLPLPTDGDVRQFGFTWPGGLSANSFEFEIQQPVGAREMEISPAPTTQTSDTAGLIYYRLALGPLTSTAKPEVELMYLKDTADLTADASAPAGPLATPAPAPQIPIDVPATLPWLLLVAGVALIGGGAIYYLRSRSEEPPSRPRHRPTRGSEQAADEVDASPVFCHNCGTQASASDRFCRRCGTAFRT